MIDRRAFIAGAVGTLAAAHVPEAPAGDRRAHIGYLSLNLTAGDQRGRLTFLRTLRELGYVEGRNLIVEYRDAKGKTDRFPGLAAELAALKVDIIVSAGGTVAALAAKHATTTIPIVFTAVGEPASEGLVTTLSRPGGNVTGFSVAMWDVVGKSLELLKQAVPSVTRVAFLLKPDAMPAPVRKQRLEAAEEAARALKIRLQVVEARVLEDFAGAFADMTRARAEAVYVAATPVFTSHQRRLVDLAAENRLPTMHAFRGWAEDGGLMSYGADLVQLSRRAATYVDKILKGTKPADLPVEQPTKFELVINLKTAKALGLTIPPSLLLRADHVIE